MRLKGLIDPAKAEIVAQENRTEKRERNPKAGLSVLDERPFYLLTCSLW